MKYHIATIALATTVSAFAGTPEPAPAPAPEAEPWIKPLLNIRARFEYGSVDAPGLRSSTAFTTRERVGLVTTDWHGLSALVEGEFTQAIVDSYDSGPGASTTPNDPTRTQIADPETNELNQAYLQYKNWDTVFRGGRQRIILDGAQFIGNVGWRQNEQTYDAFSITNNSFEDLTLFYAYANRVNRIFGSDATGGLRNFAGDVHLFNAKYTGLGDWAVAGYAYLMDFDETVASPFVSNDTYGFYATGPAGPVTLYAEFAYQTDTDSNGPTRPSDSYYTHLTASMNAGSHKFTLGWEYLDYGFVTPLATVHKFNGFADVFIGRRIGLGGGNPGLSDVYLSHSTPLPFWGLKFTQAFHVFGDNDTEFDYGWEYDAVLAKKFNENFLAIAKFAYFDSSGRTPQANNGALFDTTRFSLELNYVF
ncbi:MAG: alginate export family protein [Verrucomicrobiota bacterium]